MENTLGKNSGILVLKSKFFLYRAFIYFSFLCIPVWVQKSVHLNQALQSLMMVFYILFMAGQWFFVGKEIDHRLKIYFRVNSSIDRVVYRLLLGMSFVILYFNLLSFLPGKWINNAFWGTWVITGLFYSWPTRGKIIQESVSSSFSEFSYLDSFEKTLVGLIFALFILSTPEFPQLNNYEALKLFFDPLEKLSSVFWNFITVNYYPFKKYPSLFKVAWSMHFYYVGLGIFLTAFYGILRFFVSRRLSLLGIFAVLSSWSFSKILVADYAASISSTFPVIWVWTILWVTKSSTYRSGLILGLVGFLGTIINPIYFFLGLIQLVLLYFFFLNDKTDWFRRQIIKYALFGLILSFFVFSANIDLSQILKPIDFSWAYEIFHLIGRKAFFSLSFFGLLIILFEFVIIKNTDRGMVRLDMKKLKQLAILVGFLLLYGVFIDTQIVTNYGALWIIGLFCVIPLELIFQTLSRLRSKRNFIYLVYIIICLLDSHIEGRLKIIMRLFD